MIAFWWPEDWRILAINCTQRLEMWALGWTKLILTAHSHFYNYIGKISQPSFAQMVMIYLIYLANKTNFPYWWITFLEYHENVISPDDWLAALRSNINYAFSCRLCVMAFHISHPQWLLTLCRKSWPLGLRLELWGCILFCHIKMTMKRTT